MSDIRTPREKALDLCREVVWWHYAMGSPITIEQVMSDNRDHWVSRVRGDCIWRIRHVMGWSYPRLGRFFGLDHSTCMHHAKAGSVVTKKANLTAENARAIASASRAKLIAEGQSEWRQVEGQPKYSVSNNGLVRFDASGRIRQPVIGGNGYFYITFQNSPNGRAVYWPVHRIVMEAFAGPRPRGMQICHADGNRLNNNISNLRYDTAKGNAADRDWHGMTMRGVRNGNAKITSQSVIDQIRQDYAAGLATQYQLARQHGISQAQVNNIVLKKQHKPEQQQFGMAAE